MAKVISGWGCNNTKNVSITKKSQSQGIISKERVKENGEVFTPDSIVMDMLNMTNETFKSDDVRQFVGRTYLEPSCGDGQFLIRILSEKMERIKEESMRMLTMMNVKRTSVRLLRQLSVK